MKKATKKRTAKKSTYKREFVPRSISDTAGETRKAATREAMV